MEMRKGERIRQRKRPYSPSLFQTLSHKKKDHVDSESREKETHKRHAFDSDPYGNKFECARCGSNYIINPKLKKKKKQSHKPSPRYLKYPDQDTVMMCNACGLKEKRPKKRRHTSGSSQRNEWMDVERRKYMEECQQFTSLLSKQLGDTDAERLYCPYFSNKQCGCVQSYVLGQDKKSITEGQEVRAQNLLEFVRRSRELASLRHWEEDSSIDKTQCENGKKSSLRTVKRGIGNGQKKSLVYLEYILEKRAYLRNELHFCEKGSQKILGYSNNLLYRKLKTEDNQARLELRHGDKERLVPLSDISKEPCCTNKCTGLAKTCPGVLEEWRQRALVNKTECRRVIAEIATPYGEAFLNCNKFIRLVTGSSLVTIGKVRQQIIATGGDREPPEHGLKKYWEQKQLQQNALAHTEAQEEPQEVEKICEETKKTELNEAVRMKSQPELVEQNVSSSSGADGNINRGVRPVETGNNSGMVWTLLPNLLVKRAMLIQEQKALSQKQGMLKTKQDSVEKDLIKVLQHQGDTRRRMRKRSGPNITGSSLNSNRIDVTSHGQFQSNVCNESKLAQMVSKGGNQYAVDTCNDGRSGVISTRACAGSDLPDSGNQDWNRGTTVAGESMAEDSSFHNNKALGNQRGCPLTLSLGSTSTKRVQPHIANKNMQTIGTSNIELPFRDVMSQEKLKRNVQTEVQVDTPNPRILNMNRTPQNFNKLSSHQINSSEPQSAFQLHGQYTKPQILPKSVVHRVVHNVQPDKIVQSTGQYVPPYFAYTNSQPRPIVNSVQGIPLSESQGTTTPYIEPVTVLGSVHPLQNAGHSNPTQYIMLQVANIDQSTSPDIQKSNAFQVVSMPVLSESKAESTSSQTIIATLPSGEYSHESGQTIVNTLSEDSSGLTVSESICGNIPQTHISA